MVPVQRMDEASRLATNAGWEGAVRAVGRLDPAPRWRERAAEALHQAAGGVHALVVTCPIDQPEKGSFAVCPAAWAPLSARILEEHIPRLQAAGEGWPGLYRRAGIICPVMSALADVRVAEGLLRELLEPAGIAGYICAFLVTEREKLVGWMAVAVAQPEREVLASVAGPLARVAREAAATLSAALALAQECGASFPRAAPGDDALSPRERQIAALAAEGLSDANIAARLSIAEATVGSHLARIYRKLCVHSRVELVTRALPR